MTALLSHYPDACQAITVQRHERVFRSPLSDVAVAAFAPVTNTAYWVYVGRVNATCVPAFVAMQCRIAAGAASPGELCWATTPTAPRKAGQNLTVPTGAVTGTITALNAGGMIRNTAAFTVPCPAGSYLWAGVRTATTAPQPNVTGLIFDFGEGYVLSTATPGVLAAGTYAGALIAVGTVGQAPDLRIELD